MASSFLWHTQEVKSVVHELKTDLEQGLSNKEASSRLITYGPNKITESDSIPWANILLRQSISLMVPVLILALVILVLSEMLNIALVVIGVWIVNVMLNTIQSVKSEKTSQSLKDFIDNSIHAKVLRSGHVSTVKASNLVPGDIICFEAGDRISADGRLVEADQLIVNDFPAEGSAEPAEKDAATLGEDMSSCPVQLMKNMVFMGGIVVGGSGRAIIIATGMQTQMAMALEEQLDGEFSGQPSLIESDLSAKGLWFAGGSLAASAIVWGAMVLLGKPLLASALVGTSFFLALWPVGLIESVRTSLTIGMKKLSERQIVVRRFSKAEALASATVICSDKTGVMTNSMMIARKAFVDGHIIDIEGDGYDPDSGGFPEDAEEENPDLPLLLTVAAMSADTEVKNTPEGWEVIGDPVEAALIVAAMKGDIDKDELGLSLTQVAKLPFDSKRKRQSVLFRSSRDELFIFTRGSVETILDVCGNIQLHGYIDDFNVERRHAVWAVNQSFARDSMQSIAFAYRQLEEEPEEFSIRLVEQDLICVGIIGVTDPPRPDTKLAVKKCLDGAILPIVLTSDDEDTAFAFARELGTAQDLSEVLSGEELDILGEKDYSGVADKFSAYADVSSDQKLRIIRALKGKGESTVLISGHPDDVDAIKEADVGISTGQSGSSVAIDASDIVLMDDSFATAVDAIEIMRGTYGKTKKIIRYFLSGSVSVAGAILLSLIIGFFWKGFPSSPLSILHVIWINLLAGGIMTLAIVFNPVTGNVMGDDPHPPGKAFDEGWTNKIPVMGIVAACLTVTAFAIYLGSSASWRVNQDRSMTVALTMLVVSQIAFALQLYNTSELGFFRRLLANKLLLLTGILVILLHLAIIYISPIGGIFNTKPLSILDWIPVLIVLVICSLPLDRLLRARMEEEEHGEILEEEIPKEADETPVS